MAGGWKEQIVAKLVESLPALLIVLGGFLIVLGVAGGITYGGWLPIAGVGWRVGAVGVGLLIIGLGFYPRREPPTPHGSSFGIKIEYPQPGDRVDVLDVRGTLKKAPPAGYALKIFRVYPGSDSFVPIGGGRMSVTAGTWEAYQCDIGGKPGDRRFVAAYLVGPSGMALLDYHAKAVAVHRTTLEQLKNVQGAQEAHLPPIERRTQDMIECHRVQVIRK